MVCGVQINTRMGLINPSVARKLELIFVASYFTCHSLKRYLQRLREFCLLALIGLGGLERSQRAWFTFALERGGCHSMSVRTRFLAFLKSMF